MQLQIKVAIDKMIRLEHKILLDMQTEQGKFLLIKMNNKIQIKVAEDLGQEI
jgi:hypothetical protein